MTNIDKTYIIYTHQHIQSGKIYVGVTTYTVLRRWYQKCVCARTTKHNYKIYNYIRKYGEMEWEHQVIYCTKSQNHAYEMERYFISLYDSYHNGLNSCDGGVAPKHEKLTASHKQAISKGLAKSTKNKQRSPHTEEAKEKMRKNKIPLYGPSNPSAAIWEFTNTETKEVVITSDRVRFCKERDINYGSFNTISQRNRPYKNWVSKRLTPLPPIEKRKGKGIKKS